ncbi:undecaprenyl/decaprenyl-phosphate alpha-N-acetylglucosaminyl 1-phosphate transferase [Candidatus Microgenomates bacterium]|jgi:UDP-GlcNAc:undecaprenyl-phosphate GlcNAc-1-phosphate transferase|nr:MAG: undecaprenyl/decaprenyl-phosphate alpha-N-acetylglucosaminyl 1-phosphate transferase [Candidatus Microgenomates bacterium]
MTLTFLLPFLVSFLVSFIFTPAVILFLKKKGFVDDPKKHKHPKVVHSYPVPRGGGIPIFLGIAVSLFFLPLDKHLQGIFLGALIALVVGIFDDIFEEKIHPLLRLGGNFLAAGVVVFSGIGIAFINNPLGGIIRLDNPQLCFSLFGDSRCLWLLADLFALLWIAWTMNFVGWSGGVEGQLPGVVVIAALTIAFLSLRFSADITQWPVIILALVVAGSYLGFLPWNFSPQKIMPGYSGKSLAGFMLAVLSILSTAKVATLMLVLAVPLIDASYLVFKRLLSGRSPVWGGKEHLHHKLLALGWSKKRISVFYWSITALLGLLALQLNSRQKLYTMFMLVIAFLGIILWLSYLSASLKPPGQDNG